MNAGTKKSGLECLQRFLAQLSSDPELRNRFCADAQNTAREFALASRDAISLSALSAEQVNFFADSLIGKRLRAAGELLPLTKRALRGRFSDLFRPYAENRRLFGNKPYENDAVGFCAFLKKSAKLELRQVDWGQDAMRFDIAHLRAGLSSPIFSLTLLRYPVHAMLHDAKPMPSMRPRLTLVIWLRCARGGWLRNVIVTNPFGQRQRS